MISRRRAPRLESLFVASFVLLGFRLGARPIGDNSMLTHMRTGIDMVSGRGIPRVDPYSYTAAGHPWVVQSWFPEWTYGWAWRLGGFPAVALEQAVIMAVVAWLTLRLARTGSPLRTGLAGVVIMAIGAPFWAQRPLMFGLLGMVLTITVVERRRTPWLLIPVVWLWVNSHGSFPLGLVWLGARAVGEWRDWRSWPGEAMPYLGGFAAGLVAAALNPLGGRLLLFPFTLGGKRASFARIVEWMSPDFQSPPGRAALVGLALALVLLFRAKLAWRDLVPAVVFIVLGLAAMRNLPLTALVLAPVLGRALRPGKSQAPRPVGPAQARANRAVLVVIGLAMAVFAASVLRGPGLELDGYPVDAVAFLDRQHLLTPPHRLGHLDFVGNYLELRFGREAPVLVDDRVDMYPTAVSGDYSALLRGRRESLDILRRLQVDVVLWDRDLPLTSILEATGRWQQVFLDVDGWVVFRRVG
ncbi:MAG: hypothetical protein ACRD0Q_11650 [Acidimicrobiales bacterium]